MPVDQRHIHGKVLGKPHHGVVNGHIAVRMANEAGITLAAIARADGFEVFTHPERIAAAPKHKTDINEALHVVA